MPRRRMMDMRNPYGSRGGYVVSSRRSRRDRAMEMDYGYENKREMMDTRRRNARGQYMSDRTYEHEMPTQREYADITHESDYGSFHEERGFKPVEAMGYFTGYYGGGEDMARRDMRYDMNYYPPIHMGNRGRMDYGYDYAGDYGETLSREEIEKWSKKLMRNLGDTERKMFEKESISQKAKQMGMKMDNFTEEELAVTALMIYSDYGMTLRPIVGGNYDIYLKLAKDFLNDTDASVKGGEKLAVYHDCIVEGEDD